MVFYSALDLDKQIILYSDYFGLDLNGKKIGECIDIIRENCPKLHSDDELKELAKDNLKSIEREYGFKAVRLFMYDTMKQSLLQLYTGKNKLQIKYEKLLKDIRKYHENKLDLKLTLDIYNYYRILEDVFDEEYGVMNYYNNRLYSIVKTLDIAYYNKDVVNVLYDILYSELKMSGDKYYIKQDLKCPEVLKMLYEHIAEEHFDENVVMDYNILTEYDGYGNEYYISDYQESWVDENGYHCRFFEKESTIDDYNKVGLLKEEDMR